MISGTMLSEFRDICAGVMLCAFGFKAPRTKHCTLLKHGISLSENNVYSKFLSFVVILVFL